MYKLVKYMKFMFLAFIAALAFGCSSKVKRQDSFTIQPFSDKEIKQLSTAEVGCGCWLEDANHCSDEIYLFGDSDTDNESDYSIPALYMKINGKITKFSYQSRQYSLLLTGEPEPVIELYFDKQPKEQDIKNAILEYLKKWEKIENLSLAKDKKEKNTWNITYNDGHVLGLHGDPIEEYYLFTSENYYIRLYEYKHGSGLESKYTKGEVFIFSNEHEREEKSLFFVLICGC